MGKYLLCPTLLRACFAQYTAITRSRFSPWEGGLCITGVGSPQELSDLGRVHPKAIVYMLRGLDGCQRRGSHGSSGLDDQSKELIAGLTAAGSAQGGGAGGEVGAGGEGAEEAALEALSRFAVDSPHCEERAEEARATSVFVGTLNLLGDGNNPFEFLGECREGRV